MVNHNWWTSLLLLIWCLAAHLCIADGQSENAIGAHRVYEKTSFSCAGRPSGYYADIETGCQVYHMCDGLGRQFSYSCPNTTLFQQRMLICDHWYMVNCSKAESDYTANLLIGQRDKPFVNDEENSQRTPRPDLLDRPYAPDYSGESFRNQYKQLPAVQNQIVDKDALKNGDKIAASSQLLPGQQRWKIPPPSRTILPPAFEPQTDREDSNAGNVRFITPPITRPVTRKYSTESTTAATINRRTSLTASTITRGQFNTNNAALHQRTQLVSEEHDDLGTSHSTRYNTSADFNSAEERTPTKTGSVNSRKSFSTFNNAATNNTKNKTTNIKVPSKIYEPPFLYPIYNQNDTPSTIKPLRVSTATPFTLSAATRTTTTSTTTRPTTLAGKPFTSSVYSTTTTTASYSSTTQKRPLTFDVPAKDARTPTPAQGFKPPTPRPQASPVKSLKKPNTSETQEPELSALDYHVPSSSRLNIPTPFIGPVGTAAASTLNANPEPPAIDLLPPLKDFIQHDIATTQGPPIYYEWKAPSNGLEPPKLDAPIGTEGREYPDSVIDYNSISAGGGFTPSVSSPATSFGIDQQKTSATTTKKSYANNPFLSSKTPRSVDESTSKTPTSRSVKDTAQPGNNSIRTNKASNAPKTSSDASAITQLRDDLSVPEYLFPLENIGRTGYLSSDTYNSFQLKIPERRSDNDAEHLHWFGENPKCPECHPSYVKPGTCEPCVRR